MFRLLVLRRSEDEKYLKEIVVEEFQTLMFQCNGNILSVLQFFFHLFLFFKCLEFKNSKHFYLFITW